MHCLKCRANFLVMPIGGCEAVFGIQWLSTLGDVVWNFTDLKFHYEGGATLSKGSNKFKSTNGLKSGYVQGTLLSQHCSLRPLLSCNHLSESFTLSSRRLKGDPLLGLMTIELTWRKAPFQLTLGPIRTRLFKRM